MDTIMKDVLDKRAQGWAGVVEQLSALVERHHAEALRLLGPDRGE